MIRLILVILTTLSPAACLANPGAMMMAGKVATVSYVCTGYLGATCTLSGTPPGTYSAGADSTFGRTWTATENGTLHRVAYYFTSTWAVTNVKVVVYDASYNLIATAPITYSSGAWVWSDELVAEVGHSLSFSASDVLYFGLSVDAAGTYTVARTSGSGANWRIATGYLPDPVSWTYYDHSLAVQLEYAQ